METVYFSNSRTVIFEDLKKAITEDGKRLYSEELVQKIQSGDFNYLNDIDVLYRNNKNFMEPLLYAVRNSEFGTYEIYKYYGEDLQKEDLTIAAEIAINEPKVLEKTELTNNDTTVLYLIKYNPEIAIYISDDLKNDGEFIEKLCETGNKEAINYVVKDCNVSEVLADNPNLANNVNFMREAIKENANVLEITSEELKNNYKFMQEACMINKESINYVVEHTEEFGKDGLNAAKVVLVDNTTNKAEDEFKAELENLKNKEANLEEKENDEQPQNREEEKKQAAIKERQLRNSIKFIEKIKNGEVNQERAIRLINSICHNLGEEYREELTKYIKLDDAILEKQKEEKTENSILEPKNIEEKVSTARLPEVEKEVQIINKSTEKGLEEKTEVIK